MRIQFVRVTVASGLILALALACLSQVAAQGRQPGGAADTIIVLKKDFIEKYKNRVTIQADFAVDVVGPIHKAVKGGKDGDMHFSGRDPKIGLSIVAEIMNAKGFKKAVTAVKKAAGGDAIKLKGAWRFWCEHANNSKQVQGADLEAFPTSNPDHVFEVHPVTQVGNLDILDSVDVIPGYQYYDATTAFLHYANVRCKLSADKDTITIRTQVAGYNYVEFLLESLEDPDKHLVTKDDGRIFRANVRDTEGELVARDVRMVMIKDTAVELAARSLKKGGRLHVTAIPRIDLALVSWRVDNRDNPKYQDESPLDWALPYEMIVVGAFLQD